MNDTLGRPLRNLRLSVTDRCNLRCEYCMPEDDYVWLPREDVLHFEETSALVDVFLSLGVDKVRLTGGEPLLRRDLPELVRMIAAKPGLKDLGAHHQRRAARRPGRRAEGRRPRPHHGQPRHAPPRSLPGADALQPARGRPRRHRGGAPRLRPPQDRHRRDPRCQRRRARAVDRVRAIGQRRGPLHRIHGRRRRKPVGGPACRLAAGDAGEPRAALRRHRPDRRARLDGAGRAVRARRRNDVRHHRVDDRSLLPHVRPQPPDGRRHVVPLSLRRARPRSARAAAPRRDG